MEINQLQEGSMIKKAHDKKREKGKAIPARLKGDNKNDRVIGGRKGCLGTGKE